MPTDGFAGDWTTELVDEKKTRAAAMAAGTMTAARYIDFHATHVALFLLDLG